MKEKQLVEIINSNRDIDGTLSSSDLKRIAREIYNLAIDDAIENAITKTIQTFFGPEEEVDKESLERLKI